MWDQGPPSGKNRSEEMVGQSCTRGALRGFRAERRALAGSAEGVQILLASGGGPVTLCIFILQVLLLCPINCGLLCLHLHLSQGIIV